MSNDRIRGDFHFVQPQVRREPIGKQGEIASYVPYRCGGDITVEDIRREVARQPHLAALARALDPARRIYLLDCGNLETLQLAAEYILNFHRLFHLSDDEYEEEGLCEDDPEDDENDPEEGTADHRAFDFSAGVPYLHESDVAAVYQTGVQPIWQGPCFYETLRADSRPWWTLSLSAPVVIYSRGFAQSLWNAVSSMSERSLIVILYHRYSAEADAPFLPLDIDLANRSVDDLAFDLETDVLRLESPEATGTYKKRILRQFAREKGASFARSANLTRILSLISERRNNADNTTLGKVISNAILRRKTSGPLTNRDFQYLAELFNTQKQMKKEAEQQELIGQADVKRQLDAVVQVMALQKKREELGLKPDPIHYTFAFLGAPGTGKTTWAMRLAGEMKRRGLLNNTDSICINAAELKAKYVGHTTGKVKSLFEQYGVIILDEAYSLTEDSESDDYTREALAQLCVELENHGTDRLVVFAGYGGQGNSEDDRMLRFLQSNPGINSRVSFKIHFQSFHPRELVEVFHSMLSAGGYQAPRGADPAMEAYFQARAGERAFRNCREARNLADRAKVRMAARLDGQERLTRDCLTRLTAEDITGAIKDLLDEYHGLEKNGGRPIGFGNSRDRQEP